MRDVTFCRRQTKKHKQLQIARWIKIMSDIIVIYGPMFSNKTTRLLDFADRYTAAKQKFQAFNPKTNWRDGSTTLTDHLRTREYPATVFGSSEQILSKLERGVQHVIIEEANFADSNIVEVIGTLHSRGVGVVAAFLDLTAEGNYFPLAPSSRQSEFNNASRTTQDIIHLATIPPIRTYGKCAFPLSPTTTCAAPSTHSKYLLDDKTSAVKVGGGHEYMGCCYQHWQSALNDTQRNWHEQNATKYDAIKSRKKTNDSQSLVALAVTNR